MDQILIDEYLSTVKTATDVVDASKTFALLNDARNKFHKGLAESKVKGLSIEKEGNTSFERLECVGYYPQERRLEAVLSLRQRYGFGGPLNGSFNGSNEYVSFYVNWNGDGDFNDFSEAVCTSYVNVYDPGNNKTPICYSVYRDIIPPITQPLGSVIKVRAILSWNVKPTGPNFRPRWGNVVECLVRHQPVQ